MEFVKKFAKKKGITESRFSEICLRLLPGITDLALEEKAPKSHFTAAAQRLPKLK